MGNLRSHPVRVRGLKPVVVPFNLVAFAVAPRAGAWIETIVACSALCALAASHPVRVRGLKPLLARPVV